MDIGSEVLITSGIFLLVNIIGWVVINRRGAIIDEHRITEIEANQNQTSFRINNLPCQMNPDYSQEKGAMNQMVINLTQEVIKIEQRLGFIEKSQTEILSQIIKSRDT